MAFSLPFYVRSSSLFVSCVVNNQTNTTDWMYTKPDKSWNNVLPDCNRVCINAPIDDPKYNRTLTKGLTVVTTVIKYACAGIFNLRFHSVLFSTFLWKKMKHSYFLLKQTNTCFFKRD